MNCHSIIPPKEILNPNIYCFLYSLLKSIFIYDVNNRKKKNENIEKYIKKIQYNYNIELKREYSKENFENIIKYVKTQNEVYCGDILENILLTLFCSIMKIPQKETINKYIYFNLKRIHATKNGQEKEIAKIQNFIEYNKLLPIELKNKNAFIATNEKISSDLEYFLVLIYKLKINNGNDNKKKFSDIAYDVYNYFVKNSKNREESNIKGNSIIEFEININKVYNNYRRKTESDNKINIITYFFLTLFVNYQTINSRLIKYSNNNNNNSEFVKVPFEYNLIGSSLKANNAIIISAPVRQDNRITTVSMDENDLRELGMLELGKTIVFNKNIKIINYNKNYLYSYYFYFLNKGSQIFENNTVEEININFNFLTDDIGEYLCDILKKFKNLKKLNISSNRIYSGISLFLNQLKLLYRKKKAKLENLNLNKCSLDKISIYELCELLKSKYCKLKKLYLNVNNIDDDIADPL